jgi:hypothetical protein
MISDVKGSYWEEDNPTTPAMFSNIKNAENPACCECGLMEDKKYYLHRDKF